MIAIIDYGLGNLRSVEGAIRKVGFESLITNKIDEIEAAEKIILPGVGAFGDGIKNLHQLGLAVALTKLVREEKKPILGICLGFQLMAKESFEFGHHEGLGWIDASVKKLNTGNRGLRIPHVGWNDLVQIKNDLLFDGIPKDALFYYVHSFCVQCNNRDIVIGQCEYGQQFSAVIHTDNIFAIQAHPEKSQFYGLKLLENFLSGA